MRLHPPASPLFCRCPFRTYLAVLSFAAVSPGGVNPRFLVCPLLGFIVGVSWFFLRHFVSECGSRQSFCYHSRSLRVGSVASIRSSVDLAVEVGGLNCTYLTLYASPPCRVTFSFLMCLTSSRFLVSAGLRPSMGAVVQSVNTQFRPI